jgi:hypothetical protein
MNEPKNEPESAASLRPVCLEAVTWNDPVDAGVVFAIACESIALMSAIEAGRVSNITRDVIPLGVVVFPLEDLDSLRKVLAASAKTEAATVNV